MINLLGKDDDMSTEITTDRQMEAYASLTQVIHMGFGPIETQAQLVQVVMTSARIIRHMACDGDIAWAFGEIKKLGGDVVIYHVTKLLPTRMAIARHLHETKQLEADRAAA